MPGVRGIMPGVRASVELSAQHGFSFRDSLIVVCPPFLGYTGIWTVNLVPWLGSLLISTVPPASRARS